MKTQRRFNTAVLCLALLFALCLPALAGGGSVITWTGEMYGDWDVPGNWDLGRVPKDDDNVIIRDGAEVDFSGEVKVQLNCSGVLNVLEESTLRLTSLLGQSSSLSGDGVLYIEGDIAVTDDSLMWAGGDIIGPGKFTIDSGANLYPCR